MATFHKTVEVMSKKQFELIDITNHAKAAVTDSGVKSGMALVYNPHTTASIRMTHNEEMLKQDIMKMLYRLVPIEESYGHDVFEQRSELTVNERSNGHAHVKTFLLGTSETIPIIDGQLALGTKQSIFFVECDGGRQRDFNIFIYGEQ